MLPSSIVLSQHSRPDQPVCALSPCQPVDVLESFEAIPVGASGCVWVSCLRATTQLKAAARTEGTQMLALTSLESALHLRQTLPSTQVSPVENPRVVPASDNCNKSLKIGFTLPPCCFFSLMRGGVARLPSQRTLLRTRTDLKAQH